MKKCTILFLFSFIYSLCFSQQNISINYSYNQATSFTVLDFSSTNSLNQQNHFSTVLQTQPVQTINSFSFTQQNNYLSTYIGCFSIYGLYSKFANPTWSKPNCLSNSNLQSSTNSFVFPSSLKDNVEYSLSTKIKMPVIKNATPYIECIWIPKTQDTRFIANFCIPFFISNTKIELSSSYASGSFIKESDSWFIENPCLVNTTLTYFFQQLKLKTQHTNSYFGICTSDHPFEKNKTWYSLQSIILLPLSKLFNIQTNIKFSYYDFDYYSFTGKIIRQPYHFYCCSNFIWNLCTYRIIFAPSFDFHEDYTNDLSIQKQQIYTYDCGIKLEFLNCTLTTSFSYETQNQENTFKYFLSIWLNFYLQNFSLSEYCYYQTEIDKWNLYCKFSLREITKNTFDSYISIKTEAKYSEPDKYSIQGKLKVSVKSLFVQGEIDFSKEIKKAISENDIAYNLCIGIILKF